jgi:DNA-directed RNA polymerase subunit F
MTATATTGIAGYTAALKVLNVVKKATAASFGVATTGVKAFSTALLLSPVGKVVIALTALTGVITTVAMATGAANQRAAEAARIAEENAIAHRETTNALQEQISILEDVNNRRLDARGAQESIAINEELLYLQEQILDTIGEQVAGIDLVNGRYEENLRLLQKILIERRRAELEEARSAVTTAHDEAFANMAYVEASQRGARDMVSLHNWRQNMQEAEEVLSAFNRGTTELHSNLQNLTLEHFNLVIDLQYPEIAQQLFDPALAEKNAQAQKDAILSIISTLPDEVFRILSYITDDPHEIALLIRPDLDINRIREEVGRVLPEIADELINLLPVSELRFVINLDYESIEQFNGTTAPEFVDWLHQFQQVQAEISTQTSFEGTLASLTSHVTMLNDALSQHAQTGAISAEVYARIASAGEEFERVLTQQNGTLGVSVEAVQELIRSLVYAAIHQGVLSGYTYEMIGQFAKFIGTVRDFNSELDYLQASYSTVAQAIEEFNDAGYISISTFQSLLQLSPEYIAALDLQSGQLIINEERLWGVIDALTEQKIESLAAAAANDVHAYATGNLANASIIAQNAVANIGNNIEIAGHQARDAVGHFWEVAAAMLTMKDIDPETGITENMTAILQAYGNIASTISNMRNSINSSTVSRGGRAASGRSGGTGGGGSSARSAEPYHTELAATLLLEARLTRINELLSRNNALFNEVDGNRDKQAELLQERVALLQEQQAILHNINNINRGAMLDSIARFAEHGINVSFVPELNKLEFQQTVDEIQAIINNISIGNQEETNAVRQEMSSMLDTIIRMNETNDRNSTQWWDMRRAIYQINMDLMNMDFSGFMDGASRELESLNFQLQMLAESDVDQRIELTSRRLEVQQSIITRTNQQYQELQRALMDGRITGDQFRTAIDANTQAMQSATLAARQYAEAIAQIQLNQLNEQQSAMMNIVNLTRQMIQQEARNEIDGLNRQLGDIQNAQNALRDIERQLNDSLRDRNRLISDQIRGLNDSLRVERERIREVQGALNEELQRQRELARERQRQLNDELRAFRDLIAERRRELNRQSEDRRFGQDLSDRQLEVQRIQNRLNEIANNDSLSARAERARLNEELARRQRDLDNLVHDNDIRNQQRALDDELARFQAAHQAELDRIADALAAFERAHQDRLTMIDHEFQVRERNVNAEIENLQRQGEMYEAMINAQIEDLRRRGEEYDRQAENIRAQIDSIQDRISRNGDLTREAMRRIDEEGEKLYKRLIEWNERYGTGIREDISGAYLYRPFNVNPIAQGCAA